MSVLRTVVGTGLSVFCCSFLAYLLQKINAGKKDIISICCIYHVYQWWYDRDLYCYEIIWIVKQFLGIYSAYNDFRLQYDTDQNIHRTASAGTGRICFPGWSRIYNLLFQIILPLCKPIIATVVVFVAVGQWNSWFDNHIYTRANESLTTLQYLLYNYLNEAQRLAEQLKTASSGADMTQAMAAISPKGIRMTITVLASLPIFALYPFMQKYFSKGIMVGAVKG